MNGTWSGLELFLALGGVGLLLLFDLALTVALAASGTLTRVALRRLSTDWPAWMAFVEHLQRPASPYRSAAGMARQFALLAAVFLLATAARGAGLPWPWATATAAGAFVGVVLMEFVAARAIALWEPRRALRATAFSVRLAHAGLVSVVRPLHGFLDWVASNQQISEEEREEEQEEEVEALIEVGEREGLLEAEEGEMMRGIVDLDETPVREIMTPRTDIVALPLHTTVAEARQTLLSAGHSRLPVYRESIDHVVGVLHSRDLFRAWEERREEESVAHYLRTAVFVPESLSAADLLAEMRQKSHLSIVVDEYGGVAGLVTLEDLLEEIVGEIRDEHDEEEDLVREQDDGSFIIGAAAHVEELENLFGLEFKDRSFDTVGGLVVYGFGRVPSAGEILEIRGLLIEVLEAERRRVHRVRVRPTEQTKHAGAGP